jgi:hypothetical protein
MTDGIRRTLAVAFATVTIVAALKLVSVSAFCREHLAWVRVHDGRSLPALTHEYGIPRPDDVVFACEAPHMLGPLMLHVDFECECAPPTFTVAAISAKVRGSCRRLDQAGAIARSLCSSKCDDHLNGRSPR